MRQFTQYTGTIPGCRMRLVRVKTENLQHFNVLARFAKNIKGVTAWKEVRTLKCDMVYCG